MAISLLKRNATLVWYSQQTKKVIWLWNMERMIRQHKAGRKG